MICSTITSTLLPTLNSPTITTNLGGSHQWRFYIPNYTTKQQYDAWIVSNPITTIYQLTEPIYTKINDIEIYSHEEQTNISINGGAIPVMATVEVGTKIGAIVSQLRQEVREIDNQQSQHMKYVLNGDMRAIAEDLYPNDFIENQEL